MRTHTHKAFLVLPYMTRFEEDPRDKQRLRSGPELRGDSSSDAYFPPTLLPRGTELPPAPQVLGPLQFQFIPAILRSLWPSLSVTLPALGLHLKTKN